MRRTVNGPVPAPSRIHRSVVLSIYRNERGTSCLLRTVSGGVPAMYIKAPPSSVSPPHTRPRGGSTGRPACTLGPGSAARPVMSWQILNPSRPPRVAPPRRWGVSSPRSRSVEKAALRSAVDTLPPLHGPPRAPTGAAPRGGCLRNATIAHSASRAFECTRPSSMLLFA